MTITIQNEHQALAAREAARELRALCYTRIDDRTRCSEALARCESLALRLDGAASAAVLSIRDHLATLTTEELRATAEAWEEAAGCWEVDVGADGWRGAGRRIEPGLTVTPYASAEETGKAITDGMAQGIGMAKHSPEPRYGRPWPRTEAPSQAATAPVVLPSHYPAQHACAACGRHPATHRAGGEDACGACGLGDELEEGAG